MPPRKAPDPPCGNPILLGFLSEWLEDAKSRQAKNTLTYKRAYQSMKACPITFDHPIEAEQLTGLGPKLCERLTAEYKKYCQNNGLTMPEMPGGRREGDARKRGGADAAASGAAPAQKRAKQSTAQTRAPKMKPGNMKERQRFEEQQQQQESAARVSGSLVDSASQRSAAAIAQLEGPDEDSGSEGEGPRRTGDAARAHRERLKQLYAGPDTDYGVRRPLDQPLEAPRDPPSIRHSMRPSILNFPEVPPAVAAPAHRPTRPPVIRPPAAAAQANSVARTSPVDPTVAAAAPPRPPQRTNSSTSRSTASSSVVQNISILPRPNTEPPATTTFPPFAPIRIQAGSYTINLLLDNREMRSKTDRDYLQDHLGNRGVPPSVRPLPVGDMLWIARTKSEPHQEIVLNHIVERKRLDDLLNSIKDGRFHEQKFRLQKSGIGNVVYIIEHKQLGEIEAHTQDAIDTAIASTQVVNGFFVKRTAKVDDTIRYLVRYTKMLEMLYEGKDLFVVPDAAVDVGSYYTAMADLRSTQSSKEWGISYKAFTSVMGKSSALKLKDVFLKMLMCTRGVSAEKAMEIQRVFGTPQGLVEMLRGCAGEEERRALVMTLCDEGQLARRRKIGKAVSAKVAEVWAGVAEE